MRTMKRLAGAAVPARLALAMGTTVAAASPAAAQTPAPAPAAVAAPPETTACGFTLSPSVYGAWRDLGGETGRLGCATQKETASPPSPQGSAARTAVFGFKGEIVLHVGGPRAGQAYPVSGCFYRLYVQYSGTGGWLGLPIAESENTADGQSQAFEGGTMRLTRAYDECEATPNAAAAAQTTPAPAGDAPALTPLDLYENPSTGDRESLASQRSAEIAVAAGYQRLAGQARVMAAPGDGEAPLKLFENEDRGLHMILATPQSERDAVAAGYGFVATQGYVWTAPHAGAVPLKLYRDGATGRSRLTAGPDDESQAAAAGFTFQRIEGYAAPGS